jgi:hypothetical protein
MMRIYRQIAAIFILVFFAVQAVAAKGVDPARYGLSFTEASIVNKAAVQHAMDSVLRAHPMLSGHTRVYAIERAHMLTDRTADFYLLLLLVVLLGMIRLSNPRYFQSLIKAFWNPTMSGRATKEQLQHAGLPNLLMNLFFTMSAGAYIYYAVIMFVNSRSHNLPPVLLLLLLIAGVVVIYGGKYLMIRLSGWAFRVENVTEQYLFNVFLVNKIIAMALLPFILLLAFGDPQWLNTVLIISFLVVGLLLINRYIRSWQIFGSFFQYSKFHFFTYLCASELLPLAVLMKLLVRGLLYF